MSLKVLIVAVGICGTLILVCKNRTTFVLDEAANASVAVKQASKADRLPVQSEPKIAMLEQPSAHKFPMRYGVLERISIDPQERKCLLHGAMTEVANQDDVGVFLHWQVDINRVVANRNDWGGNSVCSVLHKIDHKNGRWIRQFSGITTPEQQWYPSGPSFPRLQHLLGEFLSGDAAIPAEFLGATYYLNPCWSDSASIAWFKTLKYLGRHEDHYFFRDPMKEETSEVAHQKIPWPQCHRGYGRMLLAHYRQRLAPRHLAKAAPLLALFAPPAQKVRYKRRLSLAWKR